MRKSKTPINPLWVKNVAGEPLPPAQMADFKRLTASMNKIFTVAIFYDTNDIERKNHYLQPTLLSALSISKTQ